MNIGARLREERERLGISQADFGQLGGAGRTTVIAWERGTAFPNAAFLAIAAAKGVDVRYVITGSRSYVPPPPLTAEEQTLLERWRDASREVKNAAMGALLGVSTSLPRTAVSQKFAGPVGQVTEGDAHLSGVTINVGAARKRKG